MKTTLLLLCLAFPLFSFALSPDLIKLKQNITDEIMNEVPVDKRSSWNVEGIKGWLSKQNPDGSFQGIDYIATESPDWGANTQVAIAQQFIRAYKMKEHPFYQDQKIFDAAVLALNYLSSKKWYHYNWWHREIGLPRNAYKLLIMAQFDLPKKELDYLMDMTYQGHLTDHPSRWPATGQNNIWYSEITTALAVLYDRPEWATLALNSVSKEFRVGQPDGIQADMSFWQHGALFYNGGYGLDFSNDTARFFRRYEGTPYKFNPEAYKVVSDYLLKGQLWLTHWKTMDFSSKGRTYCRINSGSATDLLPAYDILSTIEGKNKKEFKKYADLLRSENFPGLQGNKYFYRADFMTHNKPKFSVSIKMHSNRTLNSDTSPIGEGLKSHHLSDGLTYFHRTGKEYWNIYPIWDFKMLPGTTEEYLAVYPTVARNDYWPSYGSKDFAGGVSNGNVGAAAMDYERETLSAKKSWFMTDDVMVAMGSGISCSNCLDVRTGLNQELSESDIVYGAQEKEERLTDGEVKLTSPTWAYANGMGYDVLEGDELVLSNQTQKGTWKSIAQALSGDVVSGKVTNIYLKHGKAPDFESYIYAVYPNKTKEDFLKERKSGNIKILSNTKWLQAVYFVKEDMIQAVFHIAGKLSFDQDNFIKSEQPSAIMIMRNKKGNKITIADPSQRSKELELSYKWDNLKSDKLLFKLPAGDRAGNSITQKIQ